MNRFRARAAALALALITGLLVGGSAAAGTLHHPIYMPAVGQASSPALQPPPVCCAPVGIPPAGQPVPVNMAYFGGHVQVTPQIYLVFWGWGQAGAFDHTTPGMPANDPDGAAQRMQDFTAAIGGTRVDRQPDAVLHDPERAAGAHHEPGEPARGCLVRRRQPDPRQRERARARAGGAARSRAFRRQRLARTASS